MIKQTSTSLFIAKHLFSVSETRRLSFKTCYFGTFALLQDVHINMPFQSWEVRPKGLNNCLFTLIAAIVELEIEVKVRTYI